MVYVLAQLWPFLLAIFFVGILTAVLVRQPEEKRWISPWLKWAILALVAAAVVAQMGAVVERAGFYVENGIASFLAFLIGCFIGTRFTRGSTREHRGWAIGLVPAVAIWLVGDAVVAPRIEADLRRKVSAAIEPVGVPQNIFVVAGRDVAFSIGEEKRQALLQAVEDIDGVRIITGLEPPAPPPPPASEASDSKPAMEPAAESAAPPLAQERQEPRPLEPRPQEQVVSAAPPPPPPPPAVERPPVPEQLPVHAPPIAQIAPAPSEPPAVAAAKPEPKQAPPPAQTHDEARSSACESAISKAMGKEEIEFGRGTAKIPLSTAPVLDAVAAALKKCPSAKFEVGVHMDSSGAANESLAQRRAERLVDYFEHEGVEHGRLTGVGYAGKRQAKSGGAAPSQGVRVEFIQK